MTARSFGMPDHDVVARRDYLLAVLSGVLLALSFPEPGLSFLVWFAFVPLLLAISSKTPRNAFRLGFVCGLSAYAGILY
jgi:apolipoprotein N-acyltransferase